jgi:cytochrome b subunit of formate dehydrogenase
MLKKALIASILLLILLALSISGITFLKASLFQTVPWVLAAPVFLGFLAGGLLARLKTKTGLTAPSEPEKRHTIVSFVEHWATAAGLLVLIISGLRLKRSPDLFQANLHFLGLFIFLFFGGFFLADFFVSKKFSNLLPNLSDIIDGTLKKYLFRMKWNDKGKYLSSQKSSFLVFSAFGIGIVITGIIKMAGIMWSLPVELIQISTSIHDIAAVLFVLVVIIHIFWVLLVNYNRRLLISWFTGIIPQEVTAKKKKSSSPDK